MTHETPSLSTLKVLVVGSGAVGSFYGAHLAQAGAEVTMLCRSDYAVVKRDGITIVSIDPTTAARQTRQFRPYRVIDHIGAYADTADVILVALKVLPEIDTAALIAPAVQAQHTRILLLQNGIDVEKPLAAAFPQHEILSGLAFVCLNRVAAGMIHHLGYGRVTLGRYPTGSSVIAQRLAELFQASAIPAQLSPQIGRDRWQKLIWNAPFNPLSVLGNATTHDILRCADSARLAAEIMAEVITIAQTEGHLFGPELIAKNLEDTRNMAPYRTSMLVDHQSGRPMEIDAILGRPLRIAQEKGLKVPRLATLHALLQLLSHAVTTRR
ncbi:MAG: 2-dehydropantoate 2-reductase [Magnetococcales bacterium]|nr:2-dehydropantoate 2-reductase [Magnetococcales bacterium]